MPISLIKHLRDAFRLSCCLNIPFTISQNCMYDHIKTTSFGLIIASYNIIILYSFFLGGGGSFRGATKCGYLEMRCVLLLRFAGILYSGIDNIGARPGL